MTQPMLDPKYRIGIDEMDAQHAHWIHLIEQFRQAAAGHLHHPEGTAAARHALEQLLDYTAKHFASEERFIDAHGYPDTVRHAAKHRELEDEVRKLLAEINGHRVTTTPLKLNLFATVWLMEHIMDEDKHYAVFIQKQRRESAPHTHP